VVGEWWKRRGLAVVHQITPTISRPRTIIITMFQAPCPRRQGQADAGCRPPAPEKHVERLLAVVLKPRTTDQLGAGNGARWKTLPLHVEPKKVRATDREGDPALARVTEVFCMPTTLSALSPECSPGEHSTNLRKYTQEA
jgi:hypothetical protein